MQIKLFTAIFSVCCLMFNNSCIEATPNSSETTVCTPNGTKRRIHARKKVSNFSKKLRGVVKQLDKSSIAIDGGEYGELLAVYGYEIHHLVSSSFCRLHSKIINPRCAPAISILRNIHKQTGSHSASKYGRVYLELERFVFKSTGSIRMVFLLGMRDMKRVLKNNGASPEKIQSELKNSPYKKLFSIAATASEKKNKTLRSHVYTPIPLSFNDDVPKKSSTENFLQSRDVFLIHNAYDSIIDSCQNISVGHLTKLLIDVTDFTPDYKEAEQVLNVVIKQFFLTHPSLHRKMHPIMVSDVPNT